MFLFVVCYKNHHVHSEKKRDDLLDGLPKLSGSQKFWYYRYSCNIDKASCCEWENPLCCEIAWNV